MTQGPVVPHTGFTHRSSQFIPTFRYQVHNRNALWMTPFHITSLPQRGPHPPPAPPCRRPHLSAAAAAQAPSSVHVQQISCLPTPLRSFAHLAPDKDSRTNSLRRRIRLKTPRSAKCPPPPTRSPSHPTPRLLSNRRQPSVKFSRLRLRLAPTPSINRRPCFQAAKRSPPAASTCRRNTPQLFFNLQLHKASKWHSPWPPSPSPVFKRSVGHPAPKLRRRRSFRQASRLFNL
jgi:hypothetical protein